MWKITIHKCNLPSKRLQIKSNYIYICTYVYQNLKQTCNKRTKWRTLIIGHICSFSKPNIRRALRSYAWPLEFQCTEELRFPERRNLIQTVSRKADFYFKSATVQSIPRSTNDTRKTYAKVNALS